MKPKVLAVDDNDDALFALERVLQENGFEVQTASSGREALAKLDTESFDLVILDVVMPEMDGYAVAKTIKAHPLYRFTPIVLLTANDTLEDIIRGLEEGADDYMKKPFRPDELIARLKAVMRTRQLYQELERTTLDNQELRSQIAQRFSFASIIGKSASMNEIYRLIEKVKDSHVPVLITGESGTGKELVAKAIHFEGPRHNKAFVVQNCSAFSENLLESELFGHVKGAFTGAVRDKEGLFEVADGGTFFLDELGEMSAALQVKLLRVLQDGTFLPVGGTRSKKVDVRIVAATNRDLKRMVVEGTFREDLYYRLNVVNIRLPALRERRDDIPLLVDHFLNVRAKKDNSLRKKLDNTTMLLLANYTWPGNIRELENEIERLVLMSGSVEVITQEYLSIHVRDAKKHALGAETSPGKLKDAMENLERNMILATLERVKWNKSEAAKELGISRSNLISKVQAYRLER